MTFLSFPKLPIAWKELEIRFSKWGGVVASSILCFTVEPREFGACLWFDQGTGLVSQLHYRCNLPARQAVSSYDYILPEVNCLWFWEEYQTWPGHFDSAGVCSVAVWKTDPNVQNKKKRTEESHWNHAHHSPWGTEQRRQKHRFLGLGFFFSTERALSLNH